MRKINGLLPRRDFPYGVGDCHDEREAMKRIFVIEDDKDIVELVRYNLEKDGFQVTSTSDGGTGLAQVRKAPPDVLILDLMLPKVSGLEICKDIRKDVSLNRLPVLILTAKGEEADRVVGLELGADDYVTKPFSPRELVARVKALLRRGGARHTIGKTDRSRRAADRSRRLSGDASGKSSADEHAGISPPVLSGGASEPGVHARSSARWSVGNRAIRDAPQR